MEYGIYNQNVIKLRITRHRDGGFVDSALCERGLTVCVFCCRKVWMPFEMFDLLPKQNYSIRVAGINAAGTGPWSMYTDFTTLADVPDLPGLLDPATIGSDTVNFTWLIPQNNGDEIVQFNTILILNSSILQQHDVTIVKCRDPNKVNDTAVRICPLADRGGDSDDDVSDVVADDLAAEPVDLLANRSVVNDSTVSNSTVGPTTIENEAADDVEPLIDDGGLDEDGNFRECRENEIRDCAGICLYDSGCIKEEFGWLSCADWLGDGYCTKGNEESSTGYFPNFNCPLYGCEGQDCADCGIDFDMNLVDGLIPDFGAGCDEYAATLNITFINTVKNDAIASLDSNTSLRVNGVQVNATGAFFDGVDDYVAVPQIQFGRTGHLTIAFWMRKIGFTGNDYEYAISQNPVASRSTNIQFVVETQTYLRITLVGDDSNRLSLRVTKIALDFSEWRHIAVSIGATGTTIYLDKNVQKPADMTVLDGELANTFDGFTVNTDLFIGSREDLHPNRFFTGSLAYVSVFSQMLNAKQVACVYQGFWNVLVEQSCYWVQPELSAANEGVLNADGSQSFCGPATASEKLWHTFAGLLSGVEYSVGVSAVNGVGEGVTKIVSFFSRTAQIKAIPPLIERGVIKPAMLIAESMLLNLGDGQLQWNISSVESSAAVIIHPMSGFVQAQTVELLTLVVNSSGLAPGEHNVRVLLYSNAAARPGFAEVKVIMTVTSHADARRSRAEGDSLTRVTKGSKGYKVFIFARGTFFTLRSVVLDPRS
jgi:hypothetical protein